MNIIYTIGYSGATPAMLSQVREHLDALLVDIRLVAWSRVSHWRNEALEQLIGADNYIEVPQFGNRNYKNGGPITLNEPEMAVAMLAPLLARRNLLLLCTCADVLGCHRSEAADALLAGVAPYLPLVTDLIVGPNGVWAQGRYHQEWGRLAL